MKVHTQKRIPSGVGFYAQFRTLRRGILMMDVLLGLAIFSVFVGFLVFAMLLSQRGLLVGGDRMRAVFLSQRALEAAKAVRDTDFGALTPGTFGANITAAGTWELSGTGVTTVDYFTTTVTVAAGGTGEMDVTADTSWDFGPNRGGHVALHETFSDWRTVKPIGNWSTVALDGAYIDDGTPLFNAAEVSGNYLFATSEVSSGGAGLYVFDTTNTTTPIRVDAGFLLGSAGYELAVWNGVLAVVTGDASAEVQFYDITDPVNLSSANLIGSINVPGSGRARALAFYGNTLFLTAVEDGTEAELYTYDITDFASPTLLDSLNDSASYWDISLHDGYAYIATSSDTLELRVVDVFDPGDLQFAPGGGGYNLTDTLDALGIVTFGNYALLGRAYGDVTEELVLFDVSGSPVPSPPPGPWYAGAGDNVNALAVDSSSTYGFAATNLDAGELRVLDLAAFAAGGYPFLGSYDTDTGAGRSVYYDASNDRVILLTNTACIILKPGS